MVGASILPIAFHEGNIYFLFGKENPMEDSSHGFSDFGGGVEKGENIYTTALRECSEELSGFFGDEKTIRKHIKQSGGYYPFSYKDYHIHVIVIPFDENLPFYYNQNHHFLWNRMNTHMLNKSKLFEKIEIDWFSPNDIQHRIKEFRHFYQEIILFLLSTKLSSIIHHFHHNQSSWNIRKTKKIRSRKTKKTKKTKQK
jgi:8-oxo-dGTP pyrophosphatase MutT (NUDIX family)